MRLVVGLGNPGEKYKDTRHNLGFVVVDKLAQKIFKYPNYQIIEWKESKKFACYLLHTTDHILVKSTTFMNESGKAVSSLTNFYKLPSTDIYVVHDDLDIKLGEYKIQLGVGPKVHGGINSIEQELGTKEFWRVRLGIDNRNNELGIMNKELRIKGEDYVLQNFTNEEKEIRDRVVEKIVGELLGSVLRVKKHITH